MRVEVIFLLARLDKVDREDEAYRISCTDPLLGSATCTRYFRSGLDLVVQSRRERYHCQAG